MTEKTKTPEPWGPVAKAFGRFLLLLCALMWHCAGLFIINLGGFYHQRGRYSKEFTFVDGMPGLIMAGIMLVLASVAVAAILRGMKVSWAVVMLVWLCMAATIFLVI